MRFGRFLCFCIAALLMVQARAFEPFTIKDIQVEGNQRISAGTIFNYLPLRVGDRLDEAQSQAAIAALYKTGFFADVRLLAENGVLIVAVVERPSIATITFKGNKEISSDQLTEALKKIGLTEGRIFDQALLERVEMELQRQYLAQGRYGIKVDAKVDTADQNRVNITLVIDEGETTSIRHINIVGNKVFTDEVLLDQLQLGPAPTFGFFSTKDQYTRQKLSADLETLRSYYMDRGYLNFAITSTQVAITPDRNGVYVTINVDEGQRYSVAHIDFAGDLIVPETELRKLVAIQNGDIFSRRALTEASSAISDRLGKEGYAFANVNAVPNIKADSNEVALTFVVDPGKRVYVRRVNITGNRKTEDEVIRREMRQMESAWLAADKLERSRVRLQRLSYLEDVNIETPAVSGVEDQVDVNVSVSERPSGSLMLGVGYSDTGFILNASVSQENFLGSGKRVSAEINSGSVNTVYSFAYTNPYYTLDGVSRGFKAYYRTTDTTAAKVAQYTSDVWGGAVNYGIPLSEYNTLRAGLAFEANTIHTTSYTPPAYTSFLNANSNQFDIYKFTVGWSHDTRNRGIFPDSGFQQSLNLDYALPGSGLTFYKASSRSQWYYPLTKDLTLSLNGEVGYGDSYGETTQLPFFEKFFLGGARSVRGYKVNSLAPREGGVTIGGDLRVLGNAELVFPPPFASDSKAVRLSLFLDAGNVFGSVSDFNAGELRQSAGLSLLWLSPIGPLSFSVARPLNAQPDDKTETFQFTLGSFF